ncbi:GNAT family N-acetyltransferase [Ichthyenterobacterium sp. W332]|uniref:GNAT family N-acetyltransferase n=1 Tax=Microcosmobacter mediterraneus TaxID=3075607 RepID=A0ABU2YJK0_9FLAO|nr:GNAT family N-acetyltransferase [Ichthyenterobacterium sp. W332]MDT0558353.1 GNAT family N-acetyltransferase [Ichthyenterobacterium sp. W332]
MHDSITFKIIPSKDILTIVPLLVKLNDYKINEDTLSKRCLQMVKENYECAGVYDNKKLIGITGLWYCTRHYAGTTMEVDHVYIDDNNRGKGIGKDFFGWIHNHAKDKGCKTIELNTYVQNYPSHKFYYNLGYEILGYHFLKTL